MGVGGGGVWSQVVRKGEVGGEGGGGGGGGGGGDSLKLPYRSVDHVILWLRLVMVHLVLCCNLSQILSNERA